MCSSILDHWDPNVEEIEAELLLGEASKYVSWRSWPREWGQYADDDFAILASTRTQVHAV